MLQALYSSLNVVNLALRNPKTFLQVNFGLCHDGTVTNEQFQTALHQVLLTHPPATLGIQESLYDSLLLPVDEENRDSNLNPKENELSIPFQGLPSPPYFRALSRRLYAQYEYESTGGNSKNILVSMPEKYFLPDMATQLGFEELVHPSLDSLPQTSKQPTAASLYKWLQAARTDKILQLLGMRKTTGTDLRGLLPPSRGALLKAAKASHKKGQGGKLTVAARARAKHAHRGKEQFFGIVKGSPEKQNIESEAIVVNILNRAAWINIHAFGGTNSCPVLEARLESGYGARWTADWTDPSRPVDVQFRGFLEPQMKDGHEKGWLH